MQGVRAILNDWSARILGDSSIAVEVDATYCLVIKGQEGGTWTLHCKTPPEVFEGERRCDCKITMTAEDLIAVSERRLNPQIAYLQGKIKVEGDTLQALKLNRIMFDER